MSSIISISNMSKRFGEKTAVNAMNLSISKGEIFGLLGPNAAGKSTTIRLLSGIIAMDEGEVEILGYDLNRQMDQVKARIGYVAQFFALYPELTVAENLDFYSEIYTSVSREKKQSLLNEYGLTDVAHQRAGELSGGYKRRLSIACAMAHDPDLIFLDEPTAGIDPVTRKELWDQFYHLASQGKTLFVTTHYMEEAERCNQLAFIHHGNLVARGSPSVLINAFSDNRVFTCPIRHNPSLAEALMNTDGVLVLNQFGEQLRIITMQDVSAEQLRAVITEFESDKLQIEQVSPSIEDVFIALTREKAPA